MDSPLLYQVITNKGEDLNAVLGNVAITLSYFATRMAVGKGRLTRLIVIQHLDDVALFRSQEAGIQPGLELLLTLHRAPPAGAGTCNSMRTFLML